jgi:hypothetical protein
MANFPGKDAFLKNDLIFDVILTYGEDLHHRQTIPDDFRCCKNRTTKPLYYPQI